MPFVPRFSESGESKIIDSLLSLINTNMKPALDALYLADDLPALAVMTLGELSVFTYPLLVVFPESEDSVETEDIDEAPYLDQNLKVGLAMAVKDTSLALATRKAIKYVRALRAVLWKATTVELFPSAAVTANHLLSINHQYRQGKSKGTDSVFGAVFDLKIKFGEK